jgi:hypothetical protein
MGHWKDGFGFLATIGRVLRKLLPRPHEADATSAKCRQ